MKTRIFIFVSVFVLLPNFVFGQNFFDALSKVESATVLIRTSNPSGEQGLGTGFFINSQGLLVTNEHVIRDANFAVVKLANGAVASVKSVRAIFPDADVAFIQTDLSSSNNVALMPLDNLSRGKPIAVLGNPEGLDFSISTGIVSAIRKENALEYLQFTAPISPGSSGSPVFTTDGGVIGMATMYKKEGQNLNFGVSSNVIIELLKRSESQPQIKWKEYDPFRDARFPTQSDMTEHVSMNFAELDKFHQQVYDEIATIYQEDKEFIQQLRKTQRAWLAFRDAHLRQIWPSIETKSRPLGSAEAMCTHGALEELTRQRVIQLLTWRVGVEEGDVCAGSRGKPGFIESRERALKISKLHR